MKEVLAISNRHFIDYKKNYLIFIVISALLLTLNYLSFQEYYSDIFYTALYTIIAIPIFGLIILNKSTYLSKSKDITHKNLRILTMIVYPSIPAVLLTLVYFQIRMQNWNVGENDALYYGLIASLTGFLALLIVVFIFLELKRWTPNWPVIFGKLAVLTLYFLVIFAYPLFFNDPYTPDLYYLGITIVMIVLFITHITIYILKAYSRIEY